MKNRDTNHRSKQISESNFSDDQLEQRLAREVAAVERWTSAIRINATESFRQRNERLKSFVIAADLIDNLLQDKIEVLMAMNVFKGIVRTEELEDTGLPTGLFTSKIISLKVPHSPTCPAKVELAFQICHDSKIEDLIVDYKLQIIPIFFNFENEHQTTVPFADVNGTAICEWIDDRMVDFSRAFFQIRLHDQYHKKQMVTDPVMNMQFPQSLAFGTAEQDGRTVYFLTKESMLDFENGVSKFHSSATRIDPNANHCI